MERRRPPVPVARPIVLLVDRDDRIRAFYAIALSAMGFHVVPALDGDDAHHRAWLTRPDIIVTESPVSGVDGEMFVQDLKLDQATREIPIVVLTDQEEWSGSEQAEGECWDAMIAKSSGPAYLAFRLREILNQQLLEGTSLYRPVGKAT